MSSEKEFDWDQYNSLTSQKIDAENQLNDIEFWNRELSQQIEDLEYAKTIIKNEKDNFESIKKSVKTCIDDDYEWKGDNFDTFSENGSSLKSDNDTYYKSIDQAWDDINDKITELENKIYENEGILGGLKIFWNNLCNSIENLFN